MSRQFDAKHHVLSLFPEPCDEGVELFLDFLDVSQKDFEYEEKRTPEEYIWGKKPDAETVANVNPEPSP